MDFILLMLLGGLAGWIASLILKTNSGQGIFMDIILGIIGAIVGGLIMNLFDQPGLTGFNLYSLFVAILGALILIWIGRAITSSGGSLNLPK
ncbi:MAG: GlsB/YeaQ/YmgE family stress response membrane protein [Candidatus Doudnabacteria bacterium]|nr:GlsB/YeaQ/YmgE family stress response membrane protein [Candidatus Doudnabacteria bacterium]